jgi:uncharacterized protein (DUF342 family)
VAIAPKETIDNETGCFSLEVRGESIYLNVTEKNADNMVTVKAVKELLKKFDAKNIDDAAINKAISVTGNDVIVAGVDKPSIDVVIAENDMKAFVCISGSAQHMKFSREDILDELKKRGIVFGIDEKAAEQALANPGKQFLIAVGKDSVNGHDAQIIFKQQVNDEKGKPKAISGGRVDYKDLDLFTAVAEREVIAEKIPFKKGEDGSTVKGRILKSVAGKDRKMNVGKNIAVEGNLFVAKTAGHLVINKDRMEVLPVLEIKSDIDLSTGNITFPGNVLIKGNVQQGFFVKAQGNVRINGSIFGGTVEGKTIEVKHGIQSANDSYVKAEESITAKFVENAVLYAGGDIKITDTILHSKVSSGRKVLVTGSKGLIAGGRVTAGEEVDSKNIGTQMAPPTIVEVGINPALKEEYVRLKESYRETLSKQESIKKSLLLIKPDDSAVVPESRQELYMKMTKANFSLLGSINEMKERLVGIEEDFSKLSIGKIKCSGLVYPGVKLIINNVVYPVRDILQFSLFYLDDNEVKFAPYNQ